MWDSNAHTQPGDDGSNVLLLPAPKALISSLDRCSHADHLWCSGERALRAHHDSGVGRFGKSCTHTPPRCPGTPRGCSLFPTGMFCWDFCTLPLFSKASEAQWRRAELSHLVLCSAPSNTGDSPVAFSSCSHNYFNFAASPSEHKQSGNIWWQIPWEFLPSVGHPGLAAGSI